MEKGCEREQTSGFTKTSFRWHQRHQQPSSYYVWQVANCECGKTNSGVLKASMLDVGIPDVVATYANANERIFISHICQNGNEVVNVNLT